MVFAFILAGFLAAAVLLTWITWDGRNKSPRVLLVRGFAVLLIGGISGVFWSMALTGVESSGRFSTDLALVGLLGQLLSMYTAVLASTLVRAAWNDGHSPPTQK